MALQLSRANYPLNNEGQHVAPQPVIRVDGSGNAIPDAGGTAVGASSGSVANATASATLPAVAGKTNYIAGLEISGSGATAASVVTATITGLLGGTQSLTVPVVAGATLGNGLISIKFSPPFPGSAVNTAIVVSCPALGAGNTNNVVNVRGFVI